MAGGAPRGLGCEPGIGRSRRVGSGFSGDGWVATDFGSGLDLAFDVAISEGDGKVITNISSGRDWVTGALLQPADGKVVVVGRSGGRFLADRYLVA